MAAMAWRDAVSAGSLALVSLHAGRVDQLGRRLSHGQPGFFPCVLASAPAPDGARPPRAGVAWVPSAGTRTVHHGRGHRASPLGARGHGGGPHDLHRYLRACGFIATVALLAFLFGTLARYRWPIAIGLSVVVTLASYLVFNTGLQIRLPAGVWGW